MKRRNLEDEMDLTQESVRDLTGWCIQIALHQCFGVGRQRLIRLNQREYELTMESFAVVMTPDANGRPQGEKARALRAAAVPEGVPKEFRVPVLRAPRTRREEQLKLAGDRSATMAWQLYAKACMEVLGFGPDRLNRLYAEARANYEQMNEEGKSAGIDVAMEHLRRCACAAMQTEDIVVEEGQDDQWLQVQRQRMQEQEKTFAKRVILQEVGRRRQSRTPGAALLGDAALRQKFEAAREETFRENLSPRRSGFASASQSSPTKGSQE